MGPRKSAARGEPICCQRCRWNHQHQKQIADFLDRKWSETSAFTHEEGPARHGGRSRVRGLVGHLFRCTTSERRSWKNTGQSAARKEKMHQDACEGPAGRVAGSALFSFVFSTTPDDASAAAGAAPRSAVSCCSLCASRSCRPPVMRSTTLQSTHIVEIRVTRPVVFRHSWFMRTNASNRATSFLVFRSSRELMCSALRAAMIDQFPPE